MRRRLLLWSLVCALGTAAAVSAEPIFVNGIVIAGGTLDATGATGANQGRFGFFSDLYYDPGTEEWWALSDRGPGGGTLTYETRLQKISLSVHPVTGMIGNFQILQTIKFTDPDNLLFHVSSSNLDGLNPYSLTGNAGNLGTSFDPEGLVVDPNTGHFLVADEYGPSLYEFDRQGRLVRIFETPANLVPKVSGVVNYVATRDACNPAPTPPVLPPFCGLNAGRQDNRGYEGLAITPDGKKIYAVLQDPLVNEPAPNNGRNNRNLRIVVFDNDPANPATYRKSIAQYVYQLELQADVLARLDGDGSPTDPRQGRNIGLSAIVALNHNDFLVLERDNRGIGVEDPAGARNVGSKRVYKIRIDETTTDVSNTVLPLGDLPADITPVWKSPVWIDHTEKTVLPKNQHAEKWEGLAIGPGLFTGGRVVVVGNDNDYSVTQEAGTNVQSDIYVDFKGAYLKCPLDAQSGCQLNGAGPPDQSVTKEFSLIPGALHAYRASAEDLGHYVAPGED